MPRSWGKDTEMVNAVQDCVIRCLTTEESLVFLESKGFKMSKSKLDKIKRHIRESTDDRLDSITRSESITSYINAIDTVNSVNARLWEITRENKGTKEESKALAQISQNIKILEELYDSSHIIALLSNKLKRSVDDVS